VTQPDRPAGRGKKLEATPVKRAAERLGLRVFTPERLKPFAEEVRALAPDAFVVASYGRIVPRALLDAVPIAFNVHPSLLPLYRGATPLQSALRDGRETTGVSIIAMDEGMDTGDLLLQEPVAIAPGETYGSLHDRTAQIGARLVNEAIRRWERGETVREPQGDAAARLGFGGDDVARSATRPWTKDDWVLRPGASAAQMEGLVRALAPAPGARYEVPELGTVRILDAHVDAGPQPPPEVPAGALVRTPKRLWIRGADGWLAVERLQPPGRKPMSAGEFLSGYANVAGESAAVPR